MCTILSPCSSASPSWQFNTIFLRSRWFCGLVLQYHTLILAFPAQAGNGLPSLYDKSITYLMLNVCMDGGDEDDATWPHWEAGLTGCWGAPGSSFAVARMEQVEWLPEEREPSEEDFLPDVPAERGIKMACCSQKSAMTDYSLWNMFVRNERDTVTVPAPPDDRHIR